MTATIETQRRCPFCGERILLADCPLVATDTDTVEELRYLIEAAKEPDPPGGGGLEGRFRTVISRIDKRERLVVRPAPSMSPTQVRQHGRLREAIAPAQIPRLVDPKVAVADLPVFGLRPRRACVVCNHPLPLEADDRALAALTVAGITHASKSTLLTQLCELASSGRQTSAMGLSEFVEIEESPDDLDELAGLVERGETLPASVTPALDGHYLPWLFRITGARKRTPYLLFLHDVAGETFQDPSQRDRQAPFLAWTNAVVFLIDPEPYIKPELTSAPRSQAKVLSGVLSSTRRVDPPPVAIALAKADMLGISADSAAAEAAEVIEVLRKIGAGKLVEVARTCPSATFHFLAAHPENGEEPFGVVELFSSIASRSGLI